MKTVNLNDLSGIPKEFIMQLSQFDQIFEEVDYLSDLDNIDALQCLIREINEYCLNNEVIGFHYTRAYQDDISRLGLLSRTGKVIRADFLKKHRNHFNDTEIELIEKAWERTFNVSGEP